MKNASYDKTLMSLDGDTTTSKSFVHEVILAFGGRKICWIMMS